MKKLFASIIASAMVLSMSVTAFAAEGSATGQGAGDKTIDVTAKYDKSTSTEKVYNVDIEWDSMTFTYTEGGTKVWNPATHTYTTSTSSGWDKTEADITVTNHSNAAVTVSVEYAPVDGTGVSGAITNGSATLAAGVEGKPDEADKLTATLTISGTPNSTVTEDGVKIGTITIKIS